MTIHVELKLEFLHFFLDEQNHHFRTNFYQIFGSVEPNFWVCRTKFAEPCFFYRSIVCWLQPVVLLEFENYPEVMSSFQRDRFLEMHENVSNILFKEIYNKFGNDIEEMIDQNDKLSKLMEKLKDAITDFVWCEFYMNDNLIITK